MPHADERRGLGLRHGETAIVREVLLRDGDTPLVFAHSVVARRDVRDIWRGLSNWARGRWPKCCFMIMQ